MKIAAFALTGIFIILFSLIFATKLGQSKGYKFFTAELTMFTGFIWATVVDTSVGFFELPSILPFAGGMTLFIIASILFGKAAFTPQGPKRYESGPSSYGQNK